MPGWQGTPHTNVATWQNDTLVVIVPGNCTERWQCQVKMQTQGIVLDPLKTYLFSCSMHANRDISLVTIKLFDDVILSEKNSHSIYEGDNLVTNPTFQGGSVGNGIIVFDFGFAQMGDTITVTNIELKEAEPGTTTDPNAQPDEEGYVLVWNADFAGTHLTSNWNIEVNGDGGGNNELQYYCTKAVSVGLDPVESKHCLILTATKEDYQGKTCTSGRVNTLGNTYFQYGKIEARIWFPQTANGLWPAFWMMGNDFPSAGWPACGETDIIELGHSTGISNNTQDCYFNGASHWGPSWDQHYQYANAITNTYSVEDGFHVITCIWTPDKVAMYIDHDLYPNQAPYYEMNQAASAQTTNPGYYFNKPNFLILNLAVGGNFPGIHNINNVTALSNGPRSMYVDWVRVYQRGDAGESFFSTVASEPLEESQTETSLSAEEAGIAGKRMEDGRLLIILNGAVYDALGQPVN